MPRAATRGPTSALAPALVALAMVRSPTPLPAQASGAPVASLAPAAAAAVRKEARRVMTRWPFPAVAVGIVRGGRLVFSEGFGVADASTGAPVSDSTLFQIGSTTKAFTATLLGILVERGELEFEDRLADHLPPGTAITQSPVGREITLSQIATHHSGLPARPPTLRTRDDEPTRAFTLFELYASLERAELLTPPGQRWSYSNLGYAVLGHVLERTAGVPYEELLRREILDPLGMVETTVTLWPNLAPRLATPHRLLADGTARPSIPENMDANAPSGGLSSSVRDLARFVASQLGSSPRLDSIVSPAMRRNLYAPRWRSSNGSIGYGIGWGSARVEGVGEVVFRDGGMYGYTAYMGFSLDRSVGAIVLANLGGETGRPIRELGQRLLQIAAEVG